VVSGNEFTGEYRHQIDDKGRIAIPSKMRVLLAGPFFVSRWLDACLAIFPRGEWDAITEKVAGLPMTDPAARALERRLFAGAVEATLDAQGRILLPPNLREFAGIDGEVYVVGSRSHAEIWSPERWDAQKAVLDDDTAFAAAISGLRV
jgi:MraZ protein